MRIRRVVVRVEAPGVTPAQARALAEKALAAIRSPLRAGRVGALRVRVEASTVDDRALPKRIGRVVSAALTERERW